VNTLKTTTLSNEIVTIIKNGGIGVLRTDTLYGMVALAGNEAAVERVYTVKTRTPSKSPIVLIASTSDMFDSYDNATYRRLEELWPGRNSIILPSVKGPSWLTRGNKSIAYRVPNDPVLRAFLQKTGPLIAPSANLEGQPPAMTIRQAQTYFGNSVDFYVDSGEVTDDSPSRLYRMTPNDMERLR
jgi:L-threonylcarbamoyladenylate synthase